MRANEEKLEGMTGYRMKVVEKEGNKLVDLLHKAIPMGRPRMWEGQMHVMHNKEEGRQEEQPGLYEKKLCV